MGVLRLPPVAELCDGALLPVRDEDRVEPKALDPSLHFRNATLERATASELLARGRHGDQLADVAGAAAVPADPLQRAQQPADLVTGSAPGRVDAGMAAEPFDLDTGVLPEHPRIRRAHPATELRLRARVLVIRRPLFGRELLRFEELDRPAGQEGLELARLVLVPRAQARSYSAHRTPVT